MNARHWVSRFLPAVVACGAMLAAVQAQEAKEEAIRMPIKVSPYKDRPPVTAQTIAEGERIYDRACELCHGEKGKGEGPVAFFLSRERGPHPRNFTDGVFKFRSTPSGVLPTDEDLFRTVTNGIPGFMPSFVGLRPSDRWKVIYYVKTFYPDFKEAKPEPLPLAGAPLPLTPPSVHRGYEVYQEFKCWECHGGGGKGDGEKASELEDDWGFPLPPADLTMPSSFKNGSRPEDILRSIMTGLDGGAMASYADSFAGREEDAWHLVNYILSLSGQ